MREFGATPSQPSGQPLGAPQRRGRPPKARTVSPNGGPDAIPGLPAPNPHVAVPGPGAVVALAALHTQAQRADVLFRRGWRKLPVYVLSPVDGRVLEVLRGPRVVQVADLLPWHMAWIGIPQSWVERLGPVKNPVGGRVIHHVVGARGAKCWAVTDSAAVYREVAGALEGALEDRDAAAVARVRWAVERYEREHEKRLRGEVPVWVPEGMA